LDFLKDYFLEANPNPTRAGCPPEEKLKAMAENRLPADDSARLHLASCSECFAEYRGYRGEWEERRSARKRIAGWLAAACVLAAAGGGAWLYQLQKAEHRAQVQLASSIPVETRVNLFDEGTVRGIEGTNTLQEVSLPARVVHLSIVLPRFSDPGRYLIRVSKDKAGNEVVAQAVGDAATSDRKTTAVVTLDLRTAQTGEYYLATVRGADNGTYYYPLKIN
jgi:hypothetical protein